MQFCNGFGGHILGQIANLQAAVCPSAVNILGMASAQAGGGIFDEDVERFDGKEELEQCLIFTPGKTTGMIL